ncbi:hypothetical protein [Paenibacillus sp. UNC499MF]|uniref:hypothetical protein n=1 Tax=Paenibacillus sp. UNC499MF TaxID=1502751 RepID=UPI00089FB040|nr:hypothetical protein [Paenibacillus sp. UNC499MF]SEG50791.1 hypothetical protein SAMN02799616_03232 [Paenibacillus sp. UNC499MF]
MTWYRIFQEPENDNYQEIDEPDFSISTIPSPHSPLLNKIQYDLILQWIICPFLKQKEGLCYQVPIHTPEIQTYILNHVAGHFNTVQGIYENQKLTMIRLSELKLATQNYFQDKKENMQLSPIVNDFYMRKDLGSETKGAIDCENVEIMIREFRNLCRVEFNEMDDSLWKFFKETHLYFDGNIIVVPQNWLFSDELLTSETLAYFSRFAHRIILTINKTNNHVRAVELRVEHSL